MRELWNKCPHHVVPAECVMFQQNSSAPIDAVLTPGRNTHHINPAPKKKNRLKGFGYFEYERSATEQNPELVRLAIRCLNGFVIGEKSLKVNRLFTPDGGLVLPGSRPGPQLRPSTNPEGLEDGKPKMLENEPKKLVAGAQSKAAGLQLVLREGVRERGSAPYAMGGDEMGDSAKTEMGGTGVGEGTVVDPRVKPVGTSGWGWSLAGTIIDGLSLYPLVSFRGLWGRGGE